MTPDDHDLLATVEEFVTAVAASAHVEEVDRLPESALSFSQARVLVTVGAAAEPLPIHVLAERVGVSVATAGRHADRLVRRGLLNRDESPADRRVKLLSPTERGREVVAAHLQFHRDAVRKLVGRLPDPLREPLRSALRAVLDSGALHPDSPHTEPRG